MTLHRAGQLVEEAIALHDRLTALAGLAVREPFNYPDLRRRLRQIERLRKRVEARIERRWRMYRGLRDRRPLTASI